MSVLFKAYFLGGKVHIHLLVDQRADTNVIPLSILDKLLSKSPILKIERLNPRISTK